jgi:uncharacterized membrane protein YoaK (UPF0700 family)
MGLQNATVAAATGLTVRTTHISGPSTDLGMYLGDALFADGEKRRSALRTAGLRALKIASFVTGAAAMVPLASSLEWYAFLVPAGTILIATICSFMPRR